MEAHVEALGDHHDLTGFDCGKPPLTSWLRNHARVAATRHTARTFLLISESDVVGFYSLSAHSVDSDDLPNSMRANSLSPLPAILLGKLAIATTLQGKFGLGTSLLLDALASASDANSRAAARLLVVDPIDEDSRSFYRKRDFLPMPERGGSGRLYRSMKDIIATLS